MIEFMTLMLGLLTGQHIVEVAVTDDVSAVELRLDDHAVARREAPPWTFPLDLGTDLLPHRLEAVAFDTAGRELAKASQLVNFGRASWEASIVLDSAARGKARPGRVIWAAADRRPPLEIRIELDGKPLEVDRRGNFQLPAYDPDMPHHLAAETLFEDDRMATAETIFGGIHGERLTSALTAVPVRLDPDAELPPVAELRRILRAGDRPARIFSTETEAPSILIIRDEHATEDLSVLMRKRREKFFEAPSKLLGPDHEVTYVLTHELPMDPKGVFRTIGVPAEYYGGGLWNIIEQYYPHYTVPARQHIWWSLAQAGQYLTKSRRPRAVVLVLSKRPRNYDTFTFGQAVGYLGAVRAPLFVWAPNPDTYAELGIEIGEQTYTGPEGMAQLFRDLEAELERQRIVWIEGEYLPSEVSLSGDTLGLRLVQ